MSLNVKLFNTGYCSSLGKLAIKTDPWRCCRYPAMFALIQHPTYGNLLLDTGHSSRFYTLTQHFPMQIYRKIVHVEHDETLSAANQLMTLGILPEQIDYIIISHFHADHIGALHDFPRAKFIYLQEAYGAVKHLKHFAALRAGFLPGLIPDDFTQRSLILNHQPRVSLSSDYAPFTSGYKLFNDEHLMAIPLPGHAQGQIGLFVKTKQQGDIFFIADACWTSRAYLNVTLPHAIAFLAMTSKKDYIQTLKHIHDLKQNSPQITIIPSHCSEVWNNKAILDPIETFN